MKQVLAATAAASLNLNNYAVILSWSDRTCEESQRTPLLGLSVGILRSAENGLLRITPFLRPTQRIKTGRKRTLRPVAGVDPHVFRGEVASPIARAGFSCVQIHDNWNVLGKQAIGSSAFIERDRLAFS